MSFDFGFIYPKMLQLSNVLILRCLTTEKDFIAVLTLEPLIYRTVIGYIYNTDHANH